MLCKDQGRVKKVAFFERNKLADSQLNCHKAGPEEGNKQLSTMKKKKT